MNIIDLKRQKRVYLIGLTGNIACGKSAVLDLLKRRGASTIDADKVAHYLMEPGGAAYTPILFRFGEGILFDNLPEPRPIDRVKLGAIVFSSPAALADLEKIVHPLVLAEISQKITQATESVVIVDAIKLFESGLADPCNAVWAVTCSSEKQLERLMSRNNFPRDEALLRINSQPPQTEKIARASVVIDNSGTLAETERQVDAAWSKIPACYL